MKPRRLCKAHLRRRLSREFVKAEIAFFRSGTRDFVNDVIEPLSRDFLIIFPDGRLKSES